MHCIFRVFERRKLKEENKCYPIIYIWHVGRKSTFLFSFSSLARSLVLTLFHLISFASLCLSISRSIARFSLVLFAINSSKHPRHSSNAIALIVTNADFTIDVIWRNSYTGCYVDGVQSLCGYWIWSVVCLFARSFVRLFIKLAECHDWDSIYVICSCCCCCRCLNIQVSEFFKIQVPCIVIKLSIVYTVIVNFFFHLFFRIQAHIFFLSLLLFFFFGLCVCVLALWKFPNA